MARAVGRMELFARLGRITVAEAMVDDAFDYASERQWRERHLDNPHGQSWFTSMHVSSFPGGDPRPCPRKLAYELMAFAHTEQMPQMAIAAGVVGSAVEDWVVSMLDLDGRLLSASHDAQHQIGLEDADHWLTGSPDLIVLPKFWNRPLVIEKKTAYIDRVNEMRSLTRACVPAHARQCLGYVGLGHHISPQLWPSAVVCKHTWRLAEEGIEPVIDAMVCRDHGINADSGCLIEIELEPINSGVVLYSARDHPEVRKSWYFEHDEERFRRGLEVLRKVQSDYAHDRIPAHPFGGKQWSAEPCKYCVDPGTLVLTSDLKWVLASALQTGDELVGFDEESAGNTRTRFRKSTVESYEIIERPTKRIRTSIGYTTCSDDHLFLVRPKGHSRRKWVAAAHLAVGDQIIALGKPWMVDESRDAGYLAGVFDGEGHLHHSHLSVAQNHGPVLEKIKSCLLERRFSFGLQENEADNCVRVRINGGVYERMRLLGSIRPSRFIHSDGAWEGLATWSRHTDNAIVEEIVDVGVGPVVAMSTSTKTFIGDGLFSHNCDHKKNVCKPDHQAGVQKLTESHGVDWSKGVYGAYDPIAIRQAVLDRWKDREGFNYTLPKGYEIGRHRVQKERAHA